MTYRIETGSSYAPGRQKPRARISGWLYNPTYRTTSEYLTQIQKSPGVGTGLRELYNLGLGRQATSTQTILSKVNPTIAKIYPYLQRFL